MGWNTTIVVMNDALGNIEQDKDFGKNLAAAIRKQHTLEKRIDIPSFERVNAATVIEQHHADFLVPVIVGGNSGHIFNGGNIFYLSWNANDVEILKEIANSMGFRLVKKTGYI